MAAPAGCLCRNLIFKSQLLNSMPLTFLFQKSNHVRQPALSLQKCYERWKNIRTGGADKSTSSSLMLNNIKKSTLFLNSKRENRTCKVQTKSNSIRTQKLTITFILLPVLGHVIWPLIPDPHVLLTFIAFIHLSIHLLIN